MSSLGECSVNRAISTAVATQALGPSPQGSVLSLLLSLTSAGTQSPGGQGCKAALLTVVSSSPTRLSGAKQELGLQSKTQKQREDSQPKG